MSLTLKSLRHGPIFENSEGPIHMGNIPGKPFSEAPMSEPLQPQFDALQDKALGNNPDRAAAVAYCNAAINSGLGAFARFYGSNEKADIAAYGALSIWLETVRTKLGLEPDSP